MRWKAGTSAMAFCGIPVGRGIPVVRGIHVVRGVPVVRGVTAVVGVLAVSGVPVEVARMNWYTVFLGMDHTLHSLYI